MSSRTPREGRAFVYSHEIVDETGLTYRQIDYWTRAGLLTSSEGTGVGPGNPRQYPLEELDRAHAMKALLDAGIDIRQIAAQIDHLIRHGGYQAGPVTVTYTPEMNQ